jgi:transcriptional regulator with XRE-family HTH domain
MAALRSACSASSQSEIARRSKLTHGTINDYLNGRRQVGNMTLDTVERLLPVIRDHLPAETGRPGLQLALVEIQEQGVPYVATGSDGLLGELLEVWGKLPRSSRHAVLAAAHAEAEKGGPGNGGSSVSGTGRRVAG